MSKWKRVIIHESFVRETTFGGAPVTITGTLCGRSQLQTDGINVGRKVTCKLCLRKRKERP